MRNYWRLLIWAVLLLAALWFLHRVRSILVPFVAAWLIAMLMEPTIKRLRAAGYSRLRAVLLVCLLFFLITLLSGLLLGPPAMRQLQDLEKKVPQYVARLQRLVAEAVPDDKWLQQRERSVRALGLEPRRQAIFDQLVKPRMEDAQQYAIDLGRSLLSKLSALAGWLLQLILIPILTFVVMMDYDNLRRRAIRLIPVSIRGPSVDLMDDVGDVFTNYVRGLLLSTFLYGLLAAGIFTFFGLPSPILLGFVAGAFSAAPYVGPVLSSSLLVLVLLANPVDGLSPYLPIGGTGVHFVGTMVSYVAFDQLFGLLVMPRIAGGAVGLHLFMSFFAIAAGAVLLGFLGVVIAYPVAGSIKVVLERILQHLIEDRPKRKVRLPRVPLRFRVRSQPETG